MTCYLVHTVPGSPYGRSVMAMLEEKAADWRLAPIAQADVHGPAHVALHPFGKMPVLEWNDRRLYETDAILRYLDEALPGPSLVPADIDDRARMNQVMGICDAYLFPEGARIVVFQRVVGPAIVPGFEADEASIRAAMPRSHTIFAELSRLLGDRQWFGGAGISLADVMIGPQLELYRRTPEWAELTGERPNLARWLDRLEARPSMQATLWEQLIERLFEAA
ncbi:MAG TPA: glutathione S-transferase family protein [Sphingomonas sp.]|nr:glutathione S-transferase family protein [Sphingomonas sp.]